MSDWVQKQLERIHGKLTAGDQKGGPGSGHYGHAGRPGKRGGSVPGNVAVSIRTGRTARERQAAAASGDTRPLPKGVERFSGTLHYNGTADSTTLDEIPNIRSRGGFELNPHAYEYTEGAIAFEDKANPNADDRISVDVSNLHLVPGREGRKIWDRYKSEVRGEVDARLKRMRIKNRQQYRWDHGTPYINSEAAKRFTAAGYDGWIEEFSGDKIYRIVNLNALNEAYRAGKG